ncbi:Anthocyanidin 3-O-glucoside 2''-O-glucosyltransferase [Bienertia sinuspersici]
MATKKIYQKPLHVAMYPWFAFGHLTSFLHLANKLAEKGHKISFFLPTKAQQKLTPHNHHPQLITFIPITVPAVEGLPRGAETTADVPYEDRSLIMAAMDSTQDTIESLLGQLKPNLVFFDFTEWLPDWPANMGPSPGAYLLPRARAQPGGQDLTRPPPGFPPSKSMITLQAHEACAVKFAVTQMEFGGPGKNLLQRHAVALEACDAFAAKTCREIEGEYCDFIDNVYKKPFFLAGPMVPELPKAKLDDHTNGWLNSFDKGTVVYCALGSECFLSKDHFQQLLLGLELTGKE